MVSNGLRLGMVALGIVLLSVFSGCNKQLQDERNALYKQNEELQARYSEAQARLSATENDRANMNAELARIRAEMEANKAQQAALPAGGSGGGFSDIAGVETIRGANSITVRVPGDVLFAPGKTTLNESSKKTLAQVARVLNRDYGSAPVRVEGHTDTDPIKKSKWPSNQALSEAHQAVQEYLATQGVAGGRLSVVGYGEARPRATKALSRRVEIVVVTNQ